MDRLPDIFDRVLLIQFGFKTIQIKTMHSNIREINVPDQLSFLLDFLFLSLLLAP